MACLFLASVGMHGLAALNGALWEGTFSQATAIRIGDRGAGPGESYIVGVVD